ncbi:glycosyltransferase family 9 protein [Maribacter sp. 2307ULW6-5]|uniref:glycosyltransferase family 9 protein n=1 Tax=Maribacter sp. 2307ULW6-5 TaxID=3386275 RepID=UPI0039BC28BD
MKFLVIQQKMIGDVLTSTVICQCLKHHFPMATVHLVANQNTLPVLEGNPHIDKVVIFKNEYRQSKIALFGFLRSLKKTEYTAVLDAYGKLESNLMTLFAQADKKIGNYKWYTAWVYSHCVRQKRVSDGPLPLSISNRLMLLDPLVTENKHVSYPKIHLSATEMEQARKSLKEQGLGTGAPLVMVSILGSAPYKTYPAKYMAQLLDAICAQEEVTLLFNYIPNQKKEAMDIYDRCSPRTQQRIAIDFYAESLRGFMALLSQCQMLIGNEGGAVNMAKALDIPTFAIFSPYINKQGWHGEVYQKDRCVHLRDYRPALFGEMDKNEIKKNSARLYDAYSPDLFQEGLLQFLKKRLA